MATPQGESCIAGTWIVVEDADSTQIRNDCSFSINTRFATQASARIEVRGSPTVFGAIARVPSSRFAAFVQIVATRTWSFLGCHFSGQNVALSLERAYAPNGDSTSFRDSFFYAYPVRRAGQPDTVHYVVQSWRALPLRVAIVRSADAGASADSAALWSQLSDMSRKLCLDVFTPANEADVPASGLAGAPLAVAQVGTRVNFFLSQQVSYASITWANGRDIWAASVWLNLLTFDAGDSARSNVVKHEIAHTLGFGHTQQWQTVLYNPGGYMAGPTPLFSYDVTLTDAAYIQLWHRVIELERRYGTLFSVGEMHQWERVRILGLTEQFVAR